ncbi:DUF2500 domain-containing protein [Tumebacillus flagellatus]|uniref:DUF2500 domain-containing protein n=1 Tax=Tumebacillus flagellatus TaxID=1157490 RepID=A0A074LLK8_9BACL|nr:DUF2500 domain-containing protein [Tumebacillus flagellatus]KEO81979.1 hypothetical protein EL26_17560 [Tumebacillus flagellatus]
MTILFGLVFFVVIGIFAFVMLRGVTTWASNNASPVLTQRATVIGKRTAVGGGAMNTSAHTDYFLTFEFSDQSRREFSVAGRVFGLLTQGDTGELTYQGTRFKHFTREI